MSIDEIRKIFQVEHHNDVPKYEIIQIHSVRHKRSASGLDDVHRVNLETHGRQYRLELKPNHHLVPQEREIDLWYADAFSTNVSYSPVEKDYTEHIGDVYQDEFNQAALLLYRDKTDDALQMDGTIGDDLVVKPISSKVRSHINKSFNSEYKTDKWALYEDQDFVLEKRRTTDTDDYVFLDENEAIEDEDVMVNQDKSNRDQSRNSRFSSRINLSNQARARSRQKRDGNVDDNEQIEDEPINIDYHVVYKRVDKRGRFQHSTDYDFMEMDQYPAKRSSINFDKTETEEDDEQEQFNDINLLIQQSKSQRSRKKRQAPYLIFPEILCIIDYDGYRLHGKDNVAIKRYVISFWNGIDLRYKLLKDPGVKISIAGIIISRGRDATPYLERNRVGRDAIDSASALTDMGKYLFLERRLPVYDIAVAITKLDMCRRQSRYGECNRGTAGFAYVGGACVVNKRLEKVNSVAIVEDTGGFSGIIVAAHELGHLLGAVHDGSPPPSYLGGPGARKCRWEDGFIMSDLRHTSKGFRWSHCTIKQFHHFLNGETATCMYNSPHETESLARVLPGKLLTLDAQCRKDRGTSACFKDDRVCAQLFCFDAGSGYCVSYRPAAEGSRCGDGAICLNGKCVTEHENSVDYEGPGFLRRSGLADVNPIVDENDTPAEPSNDRYSNGQREKKRTNKRKRKRPPPPRQRGRRGRGRQ